MSAAVNVDNSQRDWVQEIEDAKVVVSMPMQYYVNKMGSQQEFTAAEVAGVLGFATSDPVYALIDSGRLEGLNRGSRTKRYYVVPRPCLLTYIKRHCNEG